MASKEDNGPPRVFISYSHKDETPLGHLLGHLAGHEEQGLLTPWHDGKIDGGDDWYDKIERELNACAVAILLVSAGFTGSEFCTRKEVPVLLERRQREGVKIVPIYVEHCSLKRHAWLKAMQMRPSSTTAMEALTKANRNKTYAKIIDEIDEFLDSEDAKTAIARRLQATEQTTMINGDGNIAIQVTGDNNVINAGFPPKPDSEWPPLPADAVDLTRLPTSGMDVVGRDDEFELLDDAFEQGKLNVVSLRAWGGVGKSTLVNKWCEYLAADNYRGARRTFAWSFYSQGASERVTSADAFIDAALRFFGDADPEVGSAWAKGERLAELVGKEKALLFLDGLEPLQDEHQGIKDPALSRLVECLAVENAGLCVITTREPVKELSDFPETTVEKNLEQLSKEAGRALLRIKGLRAGDDLLEEVSDAFGNHALALDLLASFLRLARRSVADALDIPDLTSVSVDDGKHPRRVMAAFAERFGEGPELDLLHVMGLFDRPADAGCIASLREPPAIPGLTDHLVQENGGRLVTWWRRAVGRSEAPSPDAIWEKLLTHLRSLGLLAEASQYASNELDAHPLVREHFGARLRAEREDAWKAGHERLYEHLKEQAEHRPDTLAKMAPLFQAIHHGCQAERRWDALTEVYFDRINRGQEFYSTNKLGAFGADLGLVASFFDPPFAHPAADLREDARAWLLNQAAFRLRALGRLGEAVAPMRASMEMDVEREKWKRAAASASNLSELQLTLGHVTAALASGEAAIEHADRSGDEGQRMTKRATLADARHQAGALAAAHELFEEAEAIQAEFQPGYPRLYSFQGYRYCDLLLTLGQAEAVQERAHQTLEWVTRASQDILSAALDHLSLGRAALVLGYWDEACARLDQAVDGLREAGQMDDLPRGLLARAAFFREVEEYALSRRDLDEVMRIATRSGMRLFECDAHLEYARLVLAEGRPDAARVHLKSAEVLVSDCGYHRRDPEVEELKEKLAG